MSPACVWVPPADEELTWFRPRAPFPGRPRPLEFTLDVAAFAFGASRALESLYFPLYELRVKLFEGWLYFAAVPSAMAERDLEAQARRRLDSALRFSRDIPASWERTVRKEIATYNSFMEEFPPASKVAAQLPRLKRTRANQWFAFVRAVVAPTAMAQQGIGATPAPVALQVLGEARQQVVVRGSAALDGALRRVGERLELTGEDVYRLEYGELREALTRAADGSRLTSRGGPQPESAATAPETKGLPLPPEAPHMYLIKDILQLISGEETV